MGCLDQDRFDPTIAFANLAREPLAPTLIVAGTDSYPGGNMCSSWKLIHVRADLSEQDLDGSSAEAGDLIKPVNRFLQRAQVLGNFAIQSLDSLLLVVDQIQECFEHEAVMLVEAASQRLGEQRLFA